MVSVRRQDAGRVALVPVALLGGMLGIEALARTLSPTPAPDAVARSSMRKALFEFDAAMGHKRHRRLVDGRHAATVCPVCTPWTNGRRRGGQHAHQASRHRVVTTRDARCGNTCRRAANGGGNGSTSSRP